ncbi:MAG: DnaJ domain-containing protein, partial [Spirochaetota bacterium]
MKTYYHLLNIDETADKDDIRKAFYRLAKKYHPDISNDHSYFLEILHAYKALINEKQKKSTEHFQSGSHRNSDNSGNQANASRTSDAKTAIPKNRVFYAVSLEDVARLGLYNGGRKRRSGCKIKGHDVSVYVNPGELCGGA